MNRLDNMATVKAATRDEPVRAVRPDAGVHTSGRKVLVLTSQVQGTGGIQYVGRLMGDALKDSSDPETCITAVTKLDPRKAAADGSLPYRLSGGDGSNLFTVRNWLHAWYAQHWDLVILGHVNLAPLLLLARGLRQVPVVGWVYGIEAWNPLSRLRRWGLMRVDKLLYISEHTRQTAIHWNPWLRQIPGSICHLGLRDAPPIVKTLDHEISAANPEYALVIGRMSSSERYKGHEELIRVWPRVSEIRPDLRLVIAGGGDDRERLEEIARRLAANVEFCGEVPDERRDELLANCRCLCLPSRGEGFGLVYLEAMRAGKPVLAGNSDAAREVVLDGVTGRTVSPPDPDALCQGILDVCGPDAERMGHAGCRRFHELFTYGAFRARFAQAIDTTARLAGH